MTLYPCSGSDVQVPPGVNVRTEDGVDATAICRACGARVGVRYDTTAGVFRWSAHSMGVEDGAA